jgi:hypothetical protein
LVFLLIAVFKLTTLIQAGVTNTAGPLPDEGPVYSNKKIKKEVIFHLLSVRIPRYQ